MDPEQLEKHRERVALFRYGLIADLIHHPAGARGLYKLLHEKAARDHDIPGTLRRRIAAETIRDWLQAYRSGGFDALKPKLRRDNGSCRLPQEVADLLVELKEQDRTRTVPMVIELARGKGVKPEIVLAPSSVHRLLTRRGVMQRPEEAAVAGDLRRFAFERAGQMWMSDVMHAPAIYDGRRKRKTYLLALLDDATRLVPFAAFAYAENTSAFLPIFEQAIRRRGLCERLYVDNGALYRSQHLALVCARLGITLVHARPYRPQGKGKIERFFRTVRMQLLPLLRDDDRVSLEALNRRLWAWIEGEYHQSPHKGIEGETPADRWAMTAGDVKMAGAELAPIFLFEQKRKVHKDRTVSLDGTIYEVDAMLVGETVLLRFDPARRARGVEVWHRNVCVGIAKPVDVHANALISRGRSSASVPTRTAAPEPGVRFARDTDKGGE
jgi:transposase InsO family protein